MDLTTEVFWKKIVVPIFKVSKTTSSSESLKVFSLKSVEFDVKYFKYKVFLLTSDCSGVRTDTTFALTPVKDPKSTSPFSLSINEDTGIPLKLSSRIM